MDRYSIALGKTIEPVQETTVQIKKPKKDIIYYAIFSPGYGYYIKEESYSMSLRLAKKYKSLRRACNRAIQQFIFIGRESIEPQFRVLSADPIIYSVKNGKKHGIMNMGLFPKQQASEPLSKEFIQDLLERFK